MNDFISEPNYFFRYTCKSLQKSKQELTRLLQKYTKLISSQDKQEFKKTQTRVYKTKTWV